MPLFFTLYAVMVWWLAAKTRRTAKAFAPVLLGVGILLLINWIHYELYKLTNGELDLAVVRSMMYPYTALVAGVAVFIALLPKVAAPGRCGGCGYDLSGLPGEGTGERVVCPECGRGDRPDSVRVHRRSGVDRAGPRTGDGPRVIPTRSSASEQAVETAGEQDERGQTAHQAPPQPSQRVA
ncbi:MAG: hypothetical protein AAFR38_04425 [Planctomycetota bacterium]